MLVIDATVALHASGVADGFDEFGGEALVAPPLMWSEARSALHEMTWRRAVTAEDADATRARLECCPVRRRVHRRLGDEAWRVADALGWAETYDAEYVALALLLRCRLVTLDARLRRGAERFGCVIGPDEM